MTGAINFLRKAKDICNQRKNKCGAAFIGTRCPMWNMCKEPIQIINESDLVSKVMAYKIKEVADAEGN